MFDDKYHSIVVQRQTAVTANLKSKHLQLSDFADHSSLKCIEHLLWLSVTAVSL